MNGERGHKYSLVIPVYKNSGTIKLLFSEISQLPTSVKEDLEVVFVNDASPDDAAFKIRQESIQASFGIKLLHHSRNFGAFNAIKTGIAHSTGEFIAVMAADLQEPISLIEEFFQILESGQADLVFGERVNRDDPFFSKAMSSIYWLAYSKLISDQVPSGGVDVFAISKTFKRHLLNLNEARTSLIAQLFWLGFERTSVQYARRKRIDGKSAWTFSKKLDYMLDSIFAFTDLPIRLLLSTGFFGLALSLILGAYVLVGKINGSITSPGFAATLITILFFGSINIFGLGLVGSYSWRGYENSKLRPNALVMFEEVLTNEKR